MKFGRLTVISYENTRNQRSVWKCICDCGNTTCVTSNELKSGHTTSCGCYRNELARERALKHGFSKSKLLNKWKGMISRCENKKDVNYKNYGARGITVCNEWHDYETFCKWAYANGFDESKSKREMTLDRIDVNGNYEPSNCRFADWTLQQRNKRTNRCIEYNGEKHCVSEWAELTGINYRTILNRLNNGLAIEKVLRKE